MKKEVIVIPTWKDKEGKGGAFLTEVVGYIFVMCLEGIKVDFFVFSRAKKVWEVIDPLTGRKVGVGESRKEAMEVATETVTGAGIAKLFKTMITHIRATVGSLAKTETDVNLLRRWQKRLIETRPWKRLN